MKINNKEENPRIKKLAIIGATGSIGGNTLDIVERYGSLYKAEIITAGTNVKELARLAVKHGVRKAVIAACELENELKRLLDGTGIEVASGSEAINQSCTEPDIDMVVVASVGYSGLMPTVSAIKAGKDVALANKETLVVAGEIVMSLVKDAKVSLVPIDSEHSAIAQCLKGENPENVNRLIITASGGPFRTWTRERMIHATAAEALRHPNWSMGAKITVDSATMLNKAFEIIEARWLFNIPFGRITPVIHPQSVIHSMVEFTDGAIKAQLGVPDMKLPISYALGLLTRLPGVERRLDILECGPLTFERPDVGKFPCLSLAARALSDGGNTACIINAANEVAVRAFIRDKISFPMIYDLIELALAKMPFEQSPDLEDFSRIDIMTREFISDYIKNL